jgi:hypothetical protein
MLLKILAQVYSKIHLLACAPVRLFVRAGVKNDSLSAPSEIIIILSTNNPIDTVGIQLASV